MEFISMRETERRGPLSRRQLDSMRRAGQLPGFFAGSRFLVNYTALMQLLEATRKEVQSNDR